MCAKMGSASRTSGHKSFSALCEKQEVDRPLTVMHLHVHELGRLSISECAVQELCERNMLCLFEMFLPVDMVGTVLTRPPFEGQVGIPV